ncbi:hypothetical protein IWX81_000518 [Salinibacterium sp. CAN_S4]|uniref:DUF2510 domain-containing protein n=1 Tax=Salinibacterium sp. CAN_S4 TaxID=2787727 RepID=UPI0018EF988C
MTDVMERTPPVGWYPENPESTLLRWWDGSAWTDHTIDPAQEAAIQESIATPLTRRELREQVGPLVDGQLVDGQPDSEPAEADDVVDVPEPAPEVFAAVESQPAAVPAALFDASVITEETRERIARGYTANTEINLPGLSKSGLGKNTTGPASWWDTSRQPAPTTSSTESVWALAFTPWIATLSSLGAALVYTLITPQIGAIVAGALVPILWMLATAVQDRKSLLELGFQEPASSWWILLGPLAYMIARTIRVAQVTEKGRVPLVLLLMNTIAVPAAVFAALQFLPSIMGQF